MSQFLRFLFGFLMGTLLGGLLGLLLAPRKGAETRQIIAEEIQQRLKTSREGVCASVQENTSHLRERARQVSQEMETAGRRFVHEMARKVDRSSNGGGGQPLGAGETSTAP
jgi:gas vesicle protein